MTEVKAATAFSMSPRAMSRRPCRISAALLSGNFFKMVLMRFSASSNRPRSRSSSARALKGTGESGATLAAWLR